MWLRMPSRPAMSWAENARNGLRTGSGDALGGGEAGEVRMRPNDGAHQVDRRLEARDQTVVRVQLGAATPTTNA